MAIAPRCVQSLVYSKLPTHLPLSLPGTSPRPTRRVVAVPSLSAPARPILEPRQPRQLASVDWRHWVDWIGVFKGTGAHRAARGRPRGLWVLGWRGSARHAGRAVHPAHGYAPSGRAQAGSLCSYEAFWPLRVTWLDSVGSGARTSLAHTRQPQPGSRRPRRPAQPLDEYVLARVAPYRHSLNSRF